MSALRPVLLSALLLAAAARAQTSAAPAPAQGPAAGQEEGEAPASAPEEWESFPGSAPAPQAEPPAAALPPPPPPPSPLAEPRQEAVGEARVAPPPRPEDFNHVSLFGAEPLGAGRRALGATLGFPLVGVRAAIGVTQGLDVGAAFESFYGLMNDVRAFARLSLVQAGRLDLAFSVEGGRAFFTQSPQREDRGARWLTGRRNWNVTPGFQLSLRSSHPTSARLFADARYHLAVDTEPFQRDPLGGVPPSVAFTHNVPVRFGAELPFSPSTSFLAQFGFDLHFGAYDSPFMPTLGVGVVTAL